MSHWKPSKSQRREFAQRMQNPEERAAYESRKIEKAEKRRATSQFDYATAGGNYKPTSFQFDSANNFLSRELTLEQNTACCMVINAYLCNEKVNHDYIHIVNELIRND